MEKDIVGMMIWSAGFLAVVNIVLLIVGLVQKKISAGETVIIIACTFFLPILGFVLGLVIEGKGFGGLILSFLGIMLGFAVAMWAAFIYLLIKLIKKPKVSKLNKSDTFDITEDDVLV